MADVINLRRARKARHEHEHEAAANRRRFGRTKAQKSADHEAATRSQRALDDKRLEHDESDRS